MRTRPLLFWFLSLFLVPGAGAATVRSICSSGCDHTTITAAESAAVDGDILELRETATFQERWIPGGERTLRVQTGFGFAPIVGDAGAVNFSSAGVGPVTILGDKGALTLQNGGSNTTITVQHVSSNVLTFVMEEVKLKIISGATAVKLVKFGAGHGAGSSYTIRRCEFLSEVVGNKDGILFETKSGSFLTLENNVFHDFKDSGAEAIDITGSQSANVADLINNTLADNSNAIKVNERITGTNNILADNTNDFVGAGVPVSPFSQADWTFNIFEEESNAGWPASNFLGANIEVTFVNAAADDFRLDAATTIAIDDGTTTAVTDDFFGTSRPQGPAFDIGFHEVLVVADGRMVSAGVVQNMVSAGVVQSIVD